VDLKLFFVTDMNPHLLFVPYQIVFIELTR